jgi:hypothetical protein
MQGKKPMAQTSTRVGQYTISTRPDTQLRQLLNQLEATEDLKKDLDDLKTLGLTQEELFGYEEFFIENYYIESLWKVKHE